MSNENFADYKYFHIHDDKINGCGKTAFLLKELPQIGDVIECQNIIYANGEKPTAGDLIICGACGKPLRGTAMNSVSNKIFID